VNRRSFTAVAVIVWLTAMGWLVRREYLQPESDILLDAGLSIPPGATFFAVRLGDRQVGTASITADTLTDGVRVVSRFDLDLPFAGGNRHLVSATNAEYSRDLRLERFSQRSTGAMPSTVMEGQVTGDTLVTLRMGPPDETPDETVRQPSDGPLMLPSAIPLRVALAGDLRVGQTIETHVLDPTTLSLRTERLTITRDSIFVVPDSADLDSALDVWVPATYDTVRAYRFDQTLFGLPMETWVDPSGYVIYATTPLGFTLERSAFELASENYRRSNGGSRSGGPNRPSAGLTRVPSPTPWVTRMTTVFDGAAAQLAAQDLETPWLRVAGDTVYTRGLPDPDAEAVLVVDYRFPYDGDDGPVLEPGAFDGSDPRVAAQARRIVGEERRVMAAVERLTLWVHDEINLVPPTRSMGAWRVLEQRAGDASGQAALLVALCRALGIPARPVAGLVYIGGAYHYSAWVEVWYTEWVATDPVGGHAGADAARIRLTTGSLATPGELAALIGRLEPRLIDLEVTQ
jgi:transglutaminase-like putative cysteine protease